MSENKVNLCINRKRNERINWLMETWRKRNEQQRKLNPQIKEWINKKLKMLGK